MKVTKKQFEYFRDRVRYWQGAWGLTDWEITICFGKLDKEGNRAQTGYDLDGRAATIKLASKIARKYLSKADLNLDAYHECAELALAPLGWLITSRFIARDEINDARHAFIRRLEHLEFRR